MAAYAAVIEARAAGASAEAVASVHALAESALGPALGRFQQLVERRTA
jgi:hypothetical protein